MTAKAKQDGPVASATPETATTPQQYVVLQRVLYRSNSPDYRLIEPAADPYAPDAPRVTLDHLSPAERNIVLLRKLFAPDA